MYSSAPRYLEDGKLFFTATALPGIDYLSDDILSDVIGESDDMLGLDHVNKNRSFWNRSESFFIR